MKRSEMVSDVGRFETFIFNEPLLKDLHFSPNVSFSLYIPQFHTQNDMVYYRFRQWYIPPSTGAWQNVIGILKCNFDLYMPIKGT